MLEDELWLLQVSSTIAVRVAHSKYHMRLRDISSAGLHPTDPQCHKCLGWIFEVSDDIGASGVRNNSIKLSGWCVGGSTKRHRKMTRPRVVEL